MADEDKLSTWASLIPKVYFDLIARIPAGGLLVAGLTWHFAPAFIKTAAGINSFIPAFAILFFFILISYAAGLMLTLPAGVLAYGSRSLVWAKVNRDHIELAALCDKFAALKPEKDTRLKPVVVEETMCELVSNSNEAAQNLLPKMRAEAELCNNLSIAALVLAAILASAAIRDGELLQHIEFLAATVLFAMYSAAVGMYRTWRLLDRQVIFLRLLAAGKERHQPR